MNSSDILWLKDSVSMVIGPSENHEKRRGKRSRGQQAGNHNNRKRASEKLNARFDQSSRRDRCGGVKSETESNNHRMVEE